MKTALLETIRRLRGVFWDHAIATADHGKEREFKFLRTALLDARVLTVRIATADHPQGDREKEFDKSLKRYMLEPVAIPWDKSGTARQAAIDRIADKVDRQRESESRRKKGT